MPFDEHAMRAARAAMLQAAIAAFFADAESDGAEAVYIKVVRTFDNHLEIDFELLSGGVPVAGFSL